MKIEQAIRKIITVCQNEGQKEETYSVKEEEIATPPSMDEVTRRPNCSAGTSYFSP